MPPVTGDALYAMLILGILPFNLLKGVNTYDANHPFIYKDENVD